MNLERSYSNVYKGEELGNIDLPLKSWPTDRYQASIFWAGTGENVLDVGCGNGLVLYNLRNKFKNLYGIELSSERVLTSQKTLEGLNAKIIQANIENGTAFDDDYFDVVICSDAIEHVVDVFKAMDEITRILKEGGKLVLNTPNIAYGMRRIRLLLGRFPSTSASNEGLNVRTVEEMLDGGHLHYFTFSMLERICKRGGYFEIKRYGFGRFGRLHNTIPSFSSGSCQIVAKK